MNNQAQHTILIGRARSGKTTALIEKFEQGLCANNNGLTAAYYFLVPTVEHAERVKDIVMRRAHDRGYLNLMIMTLDDFIGMMIMRHVRETAISSMLKRHILKNIVASVDLAYYKRARMCEGFSARLDAVIAELKITPDGLTRFKRVCEMSGDEEHLLRRKLQDIFTIYEAYEHFLAMHRMADNEDVLLRFLAHTRKGLLSPLTLFIDGFFDFSEAQYVFLEHILSSTIAATITLTTDMSEISGELFAVSNTTLERLRGIIPHATIVPSVGQQRLFSQQLAHLERTIFLPQAQGQTVPDTDDSVVILEAKNARYEIRWIAAQIKRFIISKKYSVHDIALIFRSCAPYIADIRSIFDEYAIPFEIHERDRLNQNPVIRSVVGALQLLGPAIEVNTLIKHARSSHTIHDENAAYELEKVFRHAGWEGETRSYGEITERDDISEAMRTAINALAKVQERFMSTATAGTFNAALRQMLVEEGIIKPGSVTAYTEDDLSAIMRLEEVLDEIETTFKDTMTGAEYLDHVRTLIDVSLYSVKNKNINAVQIYNIGNAKQKEYKVVFLCGVLDGTFPAELTEDVLLKDNEREHLIENDIRMCLFKPRIYSEKYLFYLAITRATEKLFLTYPGFDDNGRQLFASSYINEVRHCFHNKITFIVEQPADLFPALTDTMHAEALSRKALLDGAQGRGNGLTATLLKELIPQERFERLRTTTVDPAKLNDKRILAAFRRITHPFSASRLEAYAECPYRFFLEHKVKLTIPDELGNPKVLGTMSHAVLERFYKKAFRETTDRANLILFKDPVEAQARIKTLFDEVVAENNLHGLMRTDLRSALRTTLNNLLLLLTKEIEYEGERLTMPAYFEWVFGRPERSNEKAFTITFQNGATYEFCGIIDRIDLTEEQTGAVIVDYKGSESLNVNKVKSGEELQLLLYAKYVREHMGKDVIGIELYPIKKRERTGMYRDDRIHEIFAEGGTSISKQRKFSRSDFAAFEATCLKKTLECIERLRNGEISITAGSCKWCDFHSVCRCDAWGEKLKEHLGDE